MERYVIKRILQGIVTLIVLSVVVFLMPRMSGDPAYLIAGPDATEEQREEIRRKLSLDRPLPVQYYLFITRAVRGDFGESYYRQGQTVTSIIWERFPATLKLALATACVAIPLGILLGVLCAIRRNKFLDTLGKSIAVLGQSLPGFWVGITLILLFSVTLGLLPAAGMDSPKNYIMPVITLGWVGLAGVTRLTRSSMLEVLGSDFITFIRTRGIPEKSVVLKHALRNAAIPIITTAAIMIGFMLTGSIVVETVFAWPGIGRLAYNSVLMADFAMIQAIVLFYGIIFISANLLADILYAWVDPRIRY
ncbi:ABC transporter permease [Chloroflexota bacterium]